MEWGGNRSLRGAKQAYAAISDSKKKAKVKAPDVEKVAATLQKAGFDPFAELAKYVRNAQMFGGEVETDEKATLAVAQWLGDHIKAKPKAIQVLDANVRMSLLDVLASIDESGPENT